MSTMKKELYRTDELTFGKCTEKSLRIQLRKCDDVHNSGMTKDNTEKVAHFLEQTSSGRLSRKRHYDIHATNITGVNDQRYLLGYTPDGAANSQKAEQSFKQKQKAPSRKKNARSDVELTSSVPNLSGSLIYSHIKPELRSILKEIEHNSVVKVSKKNSTVSCKENEAYDSNAYELVQKEARPHSNKCSKDETHQKHEKHPKYTLAGLLQEIAGNLMTAISTKDVAQPSDFFSKEINQSKASPIYVEADHVKKETGPSGRKNTIDESLCTPGRAGLLDGLKDSFSVTGSLLHESDDQSSVKNECKTDEVSYQTVQNSDKGDPFVALLKGNEEVMQEYLAKILDDCRDNVDKGLEASNDDIGADTGQPLVQQTNYDATKNNKNSTPESSGNNENQKENGNITKELQTRRDNVDFGFHNLGVTKGNILIEIHKTDATPTEGTNSESTSEGVTPGAFQEKYQENQEVHLKIQGVTRSGRISMRVMEKGAVETEATDTENEEIDRYFNNSNMDDTGGDSDYNPISESDFDDEDILRPDGEYISGSLQFTLGSCKSAHMGIGKGRLVPTSSQQYGQASQGFEHTDIGSASCGSSDVSTKQTGNSRAHISAAASERESLSSSNVKSKTQFPLAEIMCVTFLNTLPLSNETNRTKSTGTYANKTQKTSDKLSNDGSGLRICLYCHLRFPKDEIQSHTKFHLCSDGSIKCHICDKVFVKPGAHIGSNLKRHVLQHFNPRECHICKKTFTDNSKFEIHMEKHVEKFSDQWQDDNNYNSKYEHISKNNSSNKDISVPDDKYKCGGLQCAFDAHKIMEIDKNEGGPVSTSNQQYGQASQGFEHTDIGGSSCVYFDVSNNQTSNGFVDMPTGQTGNGLADVSSKPTGKWLVDMSTKQTRNGLAEVSSKQTEKELADVSTKQKLNRQEMVMKTYLDLMQKINLKDYSSQNNDHRRKQMGKHEGSQVPTPKQHDGEASPGLQQTVKGDSLCRSLDVSIEQTENGSAHVSEIASKKKVVSSSDMESKTQFQSAEITCVTSPNTSPQLNKSIGTRSTETQGNADKLSNDESEMRLCLYCHLTFPKDEFQTHQHLHFCPDRSIKCHLCDKVVKPGAKQALKLQNHILRHLNPKTCKVCKKTFKKNCHLKAHLETHSETLSYQCKECGALFKSRANLHRHTVNKHREKKYGCPDCESRFVSEARAGTHYREKHLKSFSAMCEKCGKRFQGKKRLSKHMKSHQREKEVKQKCPHCPRECYHSSMEGHVRRCHSNSSDNLFTCEHCGKLLSSENGLATHLRQHTNTKPYKCNLCPKAYFQKNSLNIHEMIHSGARPYECSHCHKAFRSQMNLTDHIRTHTKDLPFKCPVCGKGHAKSWNMRSHAKKVHGVTVLPRHRATGAPPVDS